MTNTEQENIKHTPDSVAISMAISDQVNITHIAITMANIQGQLSQMEKRFDSIDKRFDSIDKQFEAIDRRFEAQTRMFMWVTSIQVAAIASITGRVFGLY